MNFFPSRMGLGLQGSAAAPSWTPEDMFQGGENGDWIDFTDTAKLNQDIDGLGTGVSSAGDPIGHADGVNGNVSVAPADDGTRPTFISGGGALFANASSRKHRITFSSAFSGAEDIWAAAVFSMPSSDASVTNRLITLTENADGSSDTNSALGHILLCSRGDSTNMATYHGAWKSTTAYGFSDVTTAMYSSWDFSESDNILTNDGAPETAVAYTGTGAAQMAYLHIGGIATRYSSASIYEVILLDRIPSASEISDLETYWNTKHGITFA